MEDEEQYGLTGNVLRLALAAAVTLVLTLGIYLSVSTASTQTRFAWTIAPEITTGFMGAAYIAAGVLVAGAVRERMWANARTGALVAASFTMLTSAATLQHLDRFHLDSHGAALATAWGWMLIYTVFPVALVVLIALQSRGAGPSPPRLHPVRDRDLVLYAVLALVTGGWGLVLMVDGGAAPMLWPWKVTPLTAQVIGAWLLAAGIGLALVVRERDWRRVRAVIPGFVLFGLVQLGQLVRFHEDVNSDARVALIAWVVLLVSMVLAGLYGMHRARARSSGLTAGLDE